MIEVAGRYRVFLQSHVSEQKCMEENTSVDLLEVRFKHEVGRNARICIAEEAI